MSNKTTSLPNKTLPTLEIYIQFCKLYICEKRMTKLLIPSVQLVPSHLPVIILFSNAKTVTQMKLGKAAAQKIHSPVIDMCIFIILLVIEYLYVIPYRNFYSTLFIVW